MSTAFRDAPRYSIDDYRQWKGDWELWDGVAIAMSPSPFGRHQAIAVALAAELRSALRANSCQATTLMELDWIISDDTIVRPDVMVVCGQAPPQYQESPPALVAEVLSPSTRNNDLTFKRKLYAAQGVKTYLIIDPEANSIEHLKLSESGDYQSAPASRISKLTLCEECMIEVDSEALFAV